MEEEKELKIWLQEYNTQLLGARKDA